MRESRRTVTFATTVVALFLAGASLVGCSNNASDTTEEGSDQSSQSSFDTAEEYQLAFAECMREQGIDMPDPGEDGTQVEAGKGEGFMEAAEVCADELGTPPGGDGGGAKPGEGQREFDLAMAECLRDRGLEVPDPAPGEGLTVPMDAGQDLLNECAAVADEAAGATP